MRSVDVELPASYTSALNEGQWSASRCDHFTTEKRARRLSGPELLGLNTLMAGARYIRSPGLATTWFLFSGTCSFSDGEQVGQRKKR
jgi:hypothetical protein